MRTVLFNDYVIKPPRIHPMTGDLILSFFDEDTATEYAFPIDKNDTDTYYQAIGDALGKNGAKIHMPTGADVHAATRTRG